MSQTAWSQKRARSSGTTNSYGFSSAAPVETTYSSYSHSSTWSWGLSSAANLLHTSETALTGLYQIDDKSAVQGYAIYFKDNSNDRYGIGALYKYTVSGNANTGLHLGGGLGLGKYSSSLNFMHIQGVVGVHVPILKSMMIHIDGGLTITSDDTASGKESGTYLAGMSSLFGISLLYVP